MIKFWTKFQIQIFLQFYWRAEKVIKIKLVRLLVKSFDKFSHLSLLYIFGYYFAKHAEEISNVSLFISNDTTKSNKFLNKSCYVFISFFKKIKKSSLLWTIPNAWTEILGLVLPLYQTYCIFLYYVLLYLFVKILLYFCFSSLSQHVDK